MEPQVGSILEGKVTSITNFGAFVALEGGKSGLVHISEIANTFVNDVHDFLQEGQEVKVLVLSTENGKINLSIKKAQPRPAGGGFRNNNGPRPAGGGFRSNNGPRPAGGGFRSNNGPRPAGGPRSGGEGGFRSGPRPQQPRAARPQPAPVSGDQAFEDKLKQFLSSSEGKMADLNRSIDGKRGGGRRRK